MGATSVDIALANFRGISYCATRSQSTCATVREPVLDRVVEIAQDLIRRAPGTGETLRSVGIGVPGR